VILPIENRLFEIPGQESIAQGGAVWLTRTTAQSALAADFMTICGSCRRHLALVYREIINIGRDRQSYSLDLISQFVGFLFPDGEGVRGDQVKREIPGMRGRIRNQRIRKPAYINIIFMS
jgi:hypothetical protein